MVELDEVSTRSARGSAVGSAARICSVENDLVELVVVVPCPFVGRTGSGREVVHGDAEVVFVASIRVQLLGDLNHIVEVALALDILVREASGRECVSVDRASL